MPTYVHTYISWNKNEVFLLRVVFTKHQENPVFPRYQQAHALWHNIRIRYQDRYNPKPQPINMMFSDIFQCCGTMEMEVAEIIIKDNNKFNSSVEGVPILECDYDNQPHILYRSIEQQKWPDVMDILNNQKDGSERKYILTEPSKKPKLPDNKLLSMTWVFRKKESGEVRWRALPIHAAVTFKAPSNVLEKLLKEFPEGAKMKDDRGNLPLHLGYKYGLDNRRISTIIHAYPDGVDVENKQKMVPIECVGSKIKLDKRGIEALDKGGMNGSGRRDVEGSEKEDVDGSDKKDVESGSESDFSSSFDEEVQERDCNTSVGLIALQDEDEIMTRESPERENLQEELAALKKAHQQELQKMKAQHSLKIKGVQAQMDQIRESEKKKLVEIEELEKKLSYKEKEHMILIDATAILKSKHSQEIRALRETEGKRQIEESILSKEFMADIGDKEDISDEIVAMKNKHNEEVENLKKREKKDKSKIKKLTDELSAMEKELSAMSDSANALRRKHEVEIASLRVSDLSREREVSSMKFENTVSINSTTLAQEKEIKKLQNENSLTLKELEKTSSALNEVTKKYQEALLALDDMEKQLKKLSKDNERKKALNGSDALEEKYKKELNALKDLGEKEREENAALMKKLEKMSEVMSLMEEKHKQEVKKMKNDSEESRNAVKNKKEEINILYEKLSCLTTDMENTTKTMSLVETKYEKEINELNKLKKQDVEEIKRLETELADRHSDYAMLVEKYKKAKKWKVSINRL